MLKQSGIFRENEEVADRVMDSNELERERGITILAKTTGVSYKGIKINIVDTPGHADFGGEVERALKIVDGVMLLVDASEGPLPQTRYVLMKALEAKLRRFSSSTRSTGPMRAFRKCSTRSTTCSSISTRRRTSSTFRSSTRMRRLGIAKLTPEDARKRCSRYSRRSSRHIPGPAGDPEGVLQLLVANLDYSDYLGRLAIGRVFSGTLRLGDDVAIAKLDGPFQKTRITKLYSFRGPEAGGRDDRTARRHPGHCGRRRHHHRRDGNQRRDAQAAAATFRSTSRRSR